MTILQRREAGLQATALESSLSEVPSRMSGEQGPLSLLGFQVPVRSLDSSMTDAQRLMVWKMGSSLLRTEWLCRYHQACSGHCLLEDMLVRVLMLLVSVTTIADGNREVWEY